MKPSSDRFISREGVLDRVERVFRFLSDVAKRRAPVTRRWREHAWRLVYSELPDHPNVIRFAESSESESVVLRVRRPNETNCPPPPPVLHEWIVPGWNDPLQVPRHLPTRNIEKPREGSTADDLELLSIFTVTIRFEDDASRVASLEKWTDQRRAWQDAEAPVRRVSAVYARLFELKGRLERESERFSLWVGDGVLRFSPPDGNPVEYPLLLQRCELVFDSKLPAIEIRLTSEPTELATRLLHELAVDGRTLGGLRRDLSSSEFDVLQLDAKNFVRNAAHGLFPNCIVASEHGPNAADRPTVFFDPVIFMAPRAGGMVTAIDGFLNRLKETGEVPAPLQDMLVPETVVDDTSQSTGGDVEDAVPSPNSPAHEACPSLLTKPANPEQEDVVRALEHSGGVVVQGPPGTGKTHTIANLIGHLVAQGKRVLVTSYTTKALRVLREKVVEDLRPLCVSVLDHDLDSRQQLEESVKGIDHGLSKPRSEHSQLAEESNSRRTRVWKRLLQLEADLRKAIRDQYDDIRLGGESYPPASAARRIRDEGTASAWLPGPLMLGQLCPLTVEEVGELYQTNAQVSLSEERDLGEEIPRIDGLPKPVEFARVVEDLARLIEESKGHEPRVWREATLDIRRLATLADEMQAIVATIRTADRVSLECMNSGRLGGARRQPWDDLVSTVDRIGASLDQATDLLIRFNPIVNLSWELQQQRRVCANIVTHLKRGRSLRWIRIITRPSWRRFIAGCRVRGMIPSTLDDFSAIEATYCVVADREELCRRWKAQIEPLGGMPVEKLGELPEDPCRQLVIGLRKSLGWRERTWDQLLSKIAEVGLDFEELLTRAAIRSEPCGDLLRIADACEVHLLPLLRAHHAHIEAQGISEKLRAIESVLESVGNGRITREVIGAVRARSASAYAAVWADLERVHGRATIKKRREELLSRLRAVAPAWADAVARRVAPHDTSVPPGDADRAWPVRQFEQEITRREELDPDDLRAQCTRLRDELRDHTCKLAKHRAWMHQHDKTDRRVRSALTGWLQTVNLRGYRAGVRSDYLKAEARKLLSDARKAVPVWIMPLSRVVESYDFREAQFDVVIIDEASQCDLTGLVAIGLGKQVVVVGDNKQVSPIVPGEDLGQMQTLIDEYLDGVPNKHLFTGRHSVYDLATAGFRTPIRLTEHFRCVPDIIQFSNSLSYDGEIKPLREFTSIETRPFVVAHRTVDGLREGRVNHGEAIEVASLVVAAIEQPEYANMTFGVVSMFSEEQANLVDFILAKRLNAAEYARRLVLCGTPPQFQGDERDVIFASLVDSGAKKLKTGDDSKKETLKADDDLKKRYNVAASRARNQLWVVHSFNPETDLKSGDLRLRLIQHALDPKATERQVVVESARAGSEFERLVIRRLTDAGYRFTAQYSVGAYSIDIVVFGAGHARAAVECDGDRFHPPEQLERDLERQQIITRVAGIEFVRTRGTAFFRNPDAEMRRIFDCLAKLGVEPIGAAVDDSLVERENELLNRVRRRAEELRRSWAEEEHDDEEAEDEIVAVTPSISTDESKVPAVPDRLQHLVGYRPSSASVVMVEASILSCLREALRPLSRSDILQRVSIDTNTWTVAIRRLVEGRQVVRQGSKRGARYTILQGSSPEGMSGVN